MLAKAEIGEPKLLSTAWTVFASKESSKRGAEIKCSLKAKQLLRHRCFSNFDSLSPNQD